jgi:hypothetical protein
MKCAFNQSCDAGGRIRSKISDLIAPSGNPDQDDGRPSKRTKLASKKERQFLRRRSLPPWLQGPLAYGMTIVPWNEPEVLPLT